MDTPKHLPIDKQSLINNKQNMLQIMKRAPIAGVYKGEDQRQWDNFFKFYIDFILSQSGPRGVCSREIRRKLLTHEEQVNEILQLFNMTANTHIRDIYVKFKNYSPSPHYDQLIKLQPSLTKLQQTLSKVNDQKSILYLNILQGIKKKYIQTYQQEFKQQIKRVGQHYVNKIAQTNQRIKQKLDILNHIKQFHQYMKIKAYMNDYFQEWIQADSNIGKQNVNRGQKFQNKVLQQVIPLITQISKNKIKGKIQIFVNAKWIPKNLGQIDIAVGYYDQNLKKYIVSILIECKSRLFDLRQAYNQVNNEELKKNNRKVLSTSKGQVQVQIDSDYYIITTIPQHQFLLPVQSSMKQALDRGIKTTPIKQVNSQLLYKIVKQKFQNYLSPLQWFIQNDSQRIIVLK